MQYISVAVPVPFLDRLTYRLPDHLEMPPVGARVRVPVGSRTLTGCLVQQGADPPSADGIKDIIEVVDQEPFLPPRVVELCTWVAEYYLAGIGDAIAVAMPPGARARAASFKTRQVATITPHGLSWGLASGLAPGQVPGQASGQVPGQALGQVSGQAPGQVPGQVPGQASDQAPGLTPKQRAAIEILAAAGVGLPVGELRDRGVTRDVLARLAARGLVTLRSVAEDRDPFERAAMPAQMPDPVRELTPDQRTAFDLLAALADAGEFRAALLHGVTGSGKTEIYLRLARRIQERGRQTLLMVPEIALTPSITALFRGAFGERVAIQHSALSDGERHDQWHRIRRGDVDLVIGTRSAVFAPLTRLGLIVVDEEHDTSYKQEETPRYHGRDVAIVRATHEAALVVLGSATPSMETYQNALSGKYAHAVLERRILDRPLATVRLVNMRTEYAEHGPDVIISRDLAAAIDDRLTRREQVLVLLNRRGYATAVFCRQCGDTFDCPNCTISLTVHRATTGWRARCHYCNYSMIVPKACRKCAAPYLERAGFGTAKVEEQLAETFPNARIARVDRDSVRRKGALTSLLGRFAAGELDILVGTQMIAKGHDFPRVTLVGVVSADVGLGLADFRAAERTFQLLTQVAGRAGRGERIGEAIVQTIYPDHYSIQLACRQDYRAFFDRELAYRRGMRYPPMVAVINTIVRGRTFDEAMQTAVEIVRRIEPATVTAGLSVLGPAPAPLVRLRGEHRVQFLVKGTRRTDMRRALDAALADLPQVRRRVTVDVDPLSVL